MHPHPVFDGLVVPDDVDVTDADIAAHVAADVTADVADGDITDIAGGGALDAVRLLLR